MPIGDKIVVALKRGNFREQKSPHLSPSSPFKICLGVCCFPHGRLKLNTVKPVLSGTVLSGHPLLSRQFSKSRKSFSFNVL